MVHSALFVQEIFHLFDLYTVEPILITQEGQLSEKRILPTPKLDETDGFQCLGHSNWSICSPFSPFCSEIFSTFSLLYWGTHSYYSRGPIIRKGNPPNSRI